MGGSHTCRVRRRLSAHCRPLSSIARPLGAFTLDLRIPSNANILHRLAFSEFPDPSGLFFAASTAVAEPSSGLPFCQSLLAMVDHRSFTTGAWSR